MKRYNELMKEYPQCIIFLRKGSFYGIRKEPAYIIHHLMGFRLYLSGDEYCTGCPITSMARVLDVLQEHKLNYIIADYDTVEVHTEQGTKHYEEYESLFNQYDKLRQVEIESRRDQVVQKDKLKQSVQILNELKDSSKLMPLLKATLKEMSQEEVSEAISYATKLMEDIIVYGYRQDKKRSRLKLFSLDIDSGMQLVVEHPVKISEFTLAMNSAIDSSDMRKLVATQITNWLVAKGYLSEEYDEQKNKIRIASSLGESIGITTQEHRGANGIYRTNMYDTNAQRFLVEHLCDF